MLKTGLMTLIMGAVLALSPASALAAEHGSRGGGHAGGFARGGTYSQQAPARGFSGRGEYRGGGGRYYGGYYRGGRYFYGGPGFSFGFYGAPYYGPYAYGPAPCGYYDQYGNWVPTACAIGPYGY